MIESIRYHSQNTPVWWERLNAALLCEKKKPTAVNDNDLLFILLQLWRLMWLLNIWRPTQNKFPSPCLSSPAWRVTRSAEGWCLQEIGRGGGGAVGQTLKETKWSRESGQFTGKHWLFFQALQLTQFSENSMWPGDFHTVQRYVENVSDTYGWNFKIFRHLVFQIADIFINRLNQYKPTAMIYSTKLCEKLNNLFQFMALYIYSSRPDSQLFSFSYINWNDGKRLTFKWGCAAECGFVISCQWLKLKQTLFPSRLILGVKSLLALADYWGWYFNIQLSICISFVFYRSRTKLIS